MILVLYGVGESQKLITALSGAGYRVTAAVRTEYGGVLAGRGGAVDVVFLPENMQDINILFNDKNIKMVIDASHPFKNAISDLLSAVCNNVKIPYLRFYRKETKLPEDDLIHTVYSWTEAAEKAAELGETVFLTTGSHNLDVFLNCRQLGQKRVVVRVLPEHRVIKKCQEMGVSPRDIVALQGPFSAKFNKAMFQAYKAGVVVTRDGGPGSGTDNKIKAALGLKIPVVLIKRDQSCRPGTPETCAQVLECMRELMPLQPGSQ